VKYFGLFGRWIVYTNLFIALCATALTGETFVVLQIPASDYWYLLLIFFAVLFIYNLHYYKKAGRTNQADRDAWSYKRRSFLLTLVIISLVFITGTLAIRLKDIFLNNGELNYGFFVPLGIIFLLSLAYSHPIIPFTKVTLRQAGWLKMALLSFVWALATTAVPVWLQQEQRTAARYLAPLFVHRFFFIASIAVLFNIRDYTTDKTANIKTMAVLAGPYKTLKYGKWITALLNIAAAIWLADVFSFTRPLTIAALAIPILLVFCLYHFFSPGKTGSVFAWKNDGLILLKALILIFALTYSL
jgi:4-hydroxybenzoate polyprenyltransferase